MSERALSAGRAEVRTVVDAGLRSCWPVAMSCAPAVRRWIAGFSRRRVAGRPALSSCPPPWLATTLWAAGAAPWPTFSRLGARCEVAMILTRADADRQDMVHSDRAGHPDLTWAAATPMCCWMPCAARPPGRRSCAPRRVAPWSAAPARGPWLSAAGLCCPASGAEGPSPWVAMVWGWSPMRWSCPTLARQRAASAADLAARLAARWMPAVAVLGIPEQSALLGHDGRWEVAGPGPVTVFQGGQRQRLRGGRERSCLGRAHSAGLCASYWSPLTISRPIWAVSSGLSSGWPLH